MSYSTNDKFYIDTDTSIARFEGNMDLLNSIRFGKTETDDGVNFQANIIKNRLRENINNLQIYNNSNNFNYLSLDIENLYTSNTEVNLILSVRNNTPLYSGESYTINTSPSISYTIPPGHNLIIRSSISSSSDVNKNYLPFLGTSVNLLDYSNSNLVDYFAGYADGSVSNSNILYRIDEPGSFFLTKNNGFIIKINSGNYQLYSNFLIADESYYSGFMNNDKIDISVGIYKNTNSTTSFKRFSQTDFYTPNPSLPVSLNSYYIFILGHHIYNESISFLKYYKTQDTSLLQTLPKVLLVENGNFITYFLTKTNDVSIPIYKYQTDASPSGYSFVQEDNSYSISGTSLGNTYQYVIHKLDASCIPIWKIRIVFTNINISIKDAIHVIYHSSDNSITASIINNQLTNVIIYSANNTSTILQNIYNIILHFNSSGQFQWSIKKDTLALHHKNKNSLIAYTDTTFFANYLYDVQNIDFINVFNSDGTTQNTIFKDNNEVNAINGIIYYNLLGKAQHDNYYQYRIQGNAPSSNIYSYMSILNNPSSSNTLFYSTINKNINSNVFIAYTDGYSQTLTRVQNANTVYNYNYNFNENSVGQKQVTVGNDIRITKFITDQMNITGNVLVSQDLTVDTINANENILLSSSSKIGIGKSPNEALDIVGNSLFTGNLGIGTTIQKAKLNIDAINENAININNINLVNYPLPGFYNNGYILSGSRIPSIDNTYDVKLYPPPSGANYGAGAYTYTASSTNSANVVSRAFDKNYTLYWESATSRYASTGGAYTGAISTVVSSTTYNGEWLQALLPKKLSMINYRIYRGTVAAQYCPKSWVIAGSDNGTTWTLVDSRTNQSAPTSYNEYFVNSAIQYRYYRMIITSVNGNTATSVQLTEWELYLNNVNTNLYDEYEFKIVNYKAKVNSVYNYYYNDSNLYLPLNILDSTYTGGGIWRTSNLYTKTEDSPIDKDAYLEIDIVNPITITNYTLKGNSLLTYPSKWTLEGYTGIAWTSIDSKNISATSLSQLRNTYEVTDNSLSTSNYRFKFSRNFSTTPNYIELATVSFNTQTGLNILHINSNNDITFRGNIDIIGDVYDSSITRPALKVIPNTLNNALEVYTKNNTIGMLIDNNGNIGIGTSVITNSGGGLHIFAAEGSGTTGNAGQLIVENSATNIGAGDFDARIIVKAKQTGESELVLYNDDDDVINWGKIGYDTTNIYLQQGTSGALNTGTTTFYINTTTAYYPLANVGIRTSVPYAALDIHGRTGVAVTGDKQLYIAHNTTENYGWYIGNQTLAPTATDNDLYFAVNRDGTVTDAGFLQDSAANVQMNFTGQHRCFVKDMSYSNLLQYEGLIVSANQNKYIRMSNGVAKGKDAITISESLPIVTLTNTSNDKSVFGVVSSIEDPLNRRDEYGVFVTILQKEKGDTRAYINSVGEGGIWICDINGALESGDYITSSCISGYGMKQSDDFLHNYTVAKITMNCNFNPQRIPKQTLKKITIINPDGTTKTENDLDSNGNIQWIDLLDEDGNIVYEYEYNIRLITSSGELLTEEQYIDNKLNEIPSYKAAFVGCTYHCG